MTNDEVTDEMLMAFADGELDPETGAELMRAAAADPRLADRIDVFEQSRSLTREVFAGVLAEPPPRRLVDAALAGERRREGLFARALALLSPGPILGASFAAGLLVAAGAGYLAASITAETGTSDGGLLALSPAVLDAIATTPSGAVTEVASGNGTLSIAPLGTYAVETGVCRVFEVTDASGVAVRGLGCNEGAGWSVPLLASDGAAGGYSPAGSAAVGSLDAYLDALGAGSPLTEAEEADALRVP